MPSNTDLRTLVSGIAAIIREATNNKHLDLKKPGGACRGSDLQSSA